MISDIRNFPLPTISEKNKDIAEKIKLLVEEIQLVISTSVIDNQKIHDLQWQIDYWVFKLYGIMSEDDINIIYPGFYDLKPDTFIID
jgi:hypothetical protein